MFLWTQIKEIGDILICVELRKGEANGRDWDIDPQILRVTKNATKWKWVKKKAIIKIEQEKKEANIKAEKKTLLSIGNNKKSPIRITND